MGGIERGWLYGGRLVRQRKTRDEWQLHANYGQGFEHEISEDSWKEMRDRLKEYRENAPEYQYKAVKRRVKLEVAP